VAAAAAVSGAVCIRVCADVMCVRVCVCVLQAAVAVAAAAVDRSAVVVVVVVSGADSRVPTRCRLVARARTVACR
jgi:hypothetical protein